VAAQIKTRTLATDHDYTIELTGVNIRRFFMKIHHLIDSIHKLDRSFNEWCKKKAVKLEFTPLLPIRV
jgi:hypothetical protein